MIDDKEMLRIKGIIRENERQCMIVKKLLIDKGMQWQIKTEYDRARYKAYRILAGCIEDEWKHGVKVKQKYEIYDEVLRYIRYKILIEHAVFVENKKY